MVRTEDFGPEIHRTRAFRRDVMFIGMFIDKALKVFKDGKSEKIIFRERSFCGLIEIV